MRKIKRLKAIIAALSKIQMEEGVNDAGIGLSKAALSKVVSRWEQRDEIADQVIVTKLAALGRTNKQNA